MEARKLFLCVRYLKYEVAQQALRLAPSNSVAARFFVTGATVEHHRVHVEPKVRY